MKYSDNWRDIIKSNALLIPGEHNLQNAAAAALIASLCNIEPEVTTRILSRFTGVEHRLESAGTVAGIRFINDSKATNVESTVVALKAMTGSTWLILGGRDKGASYKPIIKTGKQRIRGIIAIGEARDKIFNELGRDFQVEFAGNLQAAVARCFELASPGETVLLSPGCASFDMFDNFEHRGRVFKDAVANLKNGKRNSETVSNS